MVRKSWLSAIAVAALLLTGCATSAAAPEDGAPPSDAPAASHTMPDGSVMAGTEHGAHGAASAAEPSEAAQMICAGQVTRAITSMLDLEGDVEPTSTWNEPTFTCTYDIEGSPLMLSVDDATDVEAGEAHFAELQGSVEGAREIEGLLGLGMPSFTDDAGVVGFLRDGKTLLVDATRLPAELASGAMTRDEVAYAVASAVLVCWTEHD